MNPTPHPDKTPTPTFGLIIIGDEILSGKRADKHLPKVIELLNEVEKIMDEATDQLAAADTGGGTLAAQTEIIEKIHAAAKEKQKQPGGGQSGSAMMDMMRAVEPSPAVASLREAGAASLAARAATDALLTATPVAMVRASVVREYLATADAYDDAGLRALEDDEVINDRAGDAVPARAALDAALAAAGGV